MKSVTELPFEQDKFYSISYKNLVDAIIIGLRISTEVLNGKSRTEKVGKQIIFHSKNNNIQLLYSVKSAYFLRWDFVITKNLALE